jgi:uncharacterized damage-inducible protein DinB
MIPTNRPEASEAPEAFFSYINKVPEVDVGRFLETQLREVTTVFSAISEDASLYRYSPDKWSIRQVLSHINDCERLFTFRAFWFSRGFDSPLPSFEQDVAAAGAGADRRSLQSHLDEFGSLRKATIGLVHSLSPQGWDRGGLAGGSPMTVRALMFMVAGHVIHHIGILEERYLR